MQLDLQHFGDLVIAASLKRDNLHFRLIEVLDFGDLVIAASLKPDGDLAHDFAELISAIS